MTKTSFRKQQITVFKNLEKLKTLANVICVSDFTPVAEFEINGSFGLFWLNTGEFYYKQNHGEGLDELDWFIC